MNFCILYYLKICSIFKYFQESSLAVQMRVNNEDCDLTSLALCVCCSLLLLILQLILHGLRRNIHFEATSTGISTMTFLRVPWQTNQSSTAVPYAAERMQCKTRHVPVGQVGTYRRKTAAAEQKEIWHLELGLRIQTDSFINSQ